MRSADSLRIVIADDHGIVRSGLRALLERQRGIEVVGEASDGIEARDLAIAERPDIAILDVDAAADRARGNPRDP